MRGDFSSLSTQLVDPVTRQPFPGNQIPPDRISPAAKYFLDWIPLPNRGGRELNFVGTEQVETENQFMTKVEYNRQRQQISARYFFTDYDRPAVIPEDNILAAGTAGNAVRVQNVSVNHTFALRPTLLLHTTFGFNRQRGGSLSSGPFSYPDAGVRIASAASSALKAPPELVMNVTGGFNINTNHLGDFDRGDFTIRENLTAILGPHEMHFGGEVVRLSNHITNTFRMDGNFTFNGQLSGDGIADFLLGRASGFVQGGGEFKDLKGTRWGFFVQDNWRVNQSLTLNLGVRWDPYFPYYDREGRVVCFEPGAKSQRYPNAPAGMLYGGKDHDPGCPVGGSDANVWNIAPRAGFAYRLTEDGKTSLRGGYGHFYTPIQASAFNPFTEVRGVKDAFARSVLWGFTVGAESGGRVLVDATEWLLRDGLPLAPRLRPGSYRFEPSRSAVYMAGHPRLPEEHRDRGRAHLRAAAGGGSAAGRAATRTGRRASAAAATSRASATSPRRPRPPASASITRSSSCPTPTTRRAPTTRDRATARCASTNFAAALGQPREIQFIRRHRLAEGRSVGQGQRRGEADRLLRRSAARRSRSAPRCSKARAGGTRRSRPRATATPSASSCCPTARDPLDIRYNVINWVHRSTRGWSTGASVTDPRTGEIIKGIVTLGSLRAEQDYLIAEGLLAPYTTGTETPPELTRLGHRAHPPALGARGRPHARPRAQLLRQHRRPHLGDGLSASAGHAQGRRHARLLAASMPSGIGEWDKVAIAYGYQDFPKGTDEAAGADGDPRRGVERATSAT